MSTEPTPIFALTDVAFSYGSEFALEVDELTIEPGERVACIGPSGTGKTTLIRLMTGELLPDRGTIRFAGRCVNMMADRERRAMRSAQIGLVFQEFELVEYLTAGENILLPFHISPQLKITTEVLQRADALAAEAGIAHVLRRPPRRLSQGERQRVAICRALITQPRAILCDEPTGNLDPVIAARILDLLFDQAAQSGAAVFMVTHNHGILDRFGRVVDVGELNSRAGRGQMAGTRS